MKIRIKNRRIYYRHQAWRIRMTAEEQAWLEIVPVGREFGSKHYKRFAELDALAELATATAHRVSNRSTRRFTLMNCGLFQVAFDTQEPYGHKIEMQHGHL